MSFNTLASLILERLKSNLTLEQYYKDLNTFIGSKRGWEISEVTGDTMFITKNQYEILDKKTRERIGRIEVSYNNRSKSLTLEHIDSKDKDGNIIYGRNVLRTIFEFDLDIVKRYDIRKVFTLPADPNGPVAKYFIDTYRYEVKKMKNGYLYAITHKS